MNTKYLIGTIHSGHTDKKELAHVLENIDPDQVLIELPEGFSEASVREREVVPDEMLFAYDWTRENGVSRACFDVDSEIVNHPGLKPGALAKRQTSGLPDTLTKDNIQLSFVRAIHPRTKVRGSLGGL